MGIGSLDVTDAAALRDADWLLKLGKAKQAVRPGQNVVVRIVLDRPLDAVTEGHASVHVATDSDRSRSNNAPAGVGEGEQPFAGSEDVSSVTYATTTAATRSSTATWPGPGTRTTTSSRRPGPHRPCWTSCFVPRRSVTASPW